MSAPTHYEVLGLPPSATQADIETRFQELTRLYQIDPASPASAEGMAGLIVEAYRVLSNAALRVHYDAGLGQPTIQDREPATNDEGAQTVAAASPSVAPGSPAPSPPPSPANPERTQEIPPAAEPGSATAKAQEKTVAYPAPAPSQAEQDKRLAAELTRRGIPPDEVQRLVALGRRESGTTPARKAAVAAPPALPPSVAYVPKPTITLPAFREPTPAQRMEADRLLTAANIARRRSNFKEAETACRQALDLAPQDAAALELYGDVLQAVGRVDDALYTYQRATEADPNRKTVEKKYAELMLLQNREIEMLRDEYIPRNANVSVLLSALFPGAGQFYNGEPIKGLLIVACGLACVWMLSWTPYGFPGAHRSIPRSLVLLLVIAAAGYVYAVVDANISARRGKQRASGWEV